MPARQVRDLCFGLYLIAGTKFGDKTWLEWYTKNGHDRFSNFMSSALAELVLGSVVNKRILELLKAEHVFVFNIICIVPTESFSEQAAVI